MVGQTTGPAAAPPRECHCAVAEHGKPGHMGMIGPCTHACVHACMLPTSALYCMLSLPPEVRLGLQVLRFGLAALSLMNTPVLDLALFAAQHAWHGCSCENREGCHSAKAGWPDSERVCACWTPKSRNHTDHPPHLIPTDALAHLPPLHTSPILGI